MAKNSHLSPEDLQAETLRAYGDIMEEWAELEAILAGCLKVLGGIDDGGKARIIWATLPNMQARTRLLMRLSENYLRDDDRPAFRRWMKRVRDLGAKRNMIAHSPSRYDPDARKIHFMKLDRERKDGTMVFLEHHFETLNNVQQWAKAIETLRVELWAFSQTEEARMHASSKTHREQPANPTP